MIQSIDTLKARMGEVGHLRNATSVLEWDLQTYMPPGGAQARSEQIGFLSRLAHEMFTAEETGRLLVQGEADAQGFAPDSDEARLLKNVRRDFDQAVRIPAALAAEVSQHSAFAQEVWAKARGADDFATFAPLLAKGIDLARQVADHLGYQDDPYDALLDQYEPGVRTAQVAAMFAEIKPQLIELTQAIVASPRYAQDTRLTGTFPVARQNEITTRLVQAVGYDMQRGRQDQAPHPFCTGFTRDDVRITTRFCEDYLPAGLYASLHEAGHALYEQGSPPEFDNTPLGGGASMGVHESQSRLWENLVGRGRPFCRYVLPSLQEAFPDLGGWSVDSFYRAVNRVTPSLIRVEADEVTYNLHVLLRFELECDMLAGRVTIAELPDAWNTKMEDYLGITPPNYTEGVLQDVHWAAGLIGYFPTYTLGNLLSGQFWHTLRAALPDLDAQITRGEFAPLLAWLRDHIHCHGRKYLPDELIVRTTGEPLTSRYYLEYLKAKYADLYELTK